ncbi:dipeptidase [Tautonia plasticadhaerens]|uniref:Membrane dipeptidase (Peptidase family M19) n=1 Tax=Tautonia plasticadhaerens TaxID=2527974 RepID=A0A518GVJ7_9BACT|nr:dipeptidase [Tautonia plasticadhaerens]QDV32622.1 Membrane dipeptidase (Peptidase family M19) [Tautonia plasticadhaerens]
MPPLPMACWAPLILSTPIFAPAPGDDSPESRAAEVHAGALLIDGHNDLPWRLRSDGDVAFGAIDLADRLDSGHTDIPRLRIGGVDAQFWSVYIPSEHPDPAQTVLQQIDLVYRMAERYPDAFEIARTAGDVERIAASGKVASLIGIEGGVAIEGDLALLRNFARLGVRYMTLTHNSSLPWADAATDDAISGGLSPFGERVVKEMNRLGMLVDISHVSEETMDDCLRVSEAPVIASHSSAYAIAPHPRNVPDAILRRLPENGGVVMVNFYPSFIVPDASAKMAEARERFRAEHPDDDEAYREALRGWMGEHAEELRGEVSVVADHVDHIVEIAGIDHVGIGGDYDGIGSVPVGLEDVSTYPNLTGELLRRGYSDEDVRKVLGGNALRVLREAEEVADRLRSQVPPDVQQPEPRAEDE